jgi:hypothetical protein
VTNVAKSVSKKVIEKMVIGEISFSKKNRKKINPVNGKWIPMKATNKNL